MPKIAKAIRPITYKKTFRSLEVVFVYLKFLAESFLRKMNSPYYTEDLLARQNNYSEFIRSISMPLLSHLALNSSARYLLYIE